MAAIDRDQLYSDTVLYLPDANVLSEDEIRNINSLVIENQIPEDDDQYYSEALCKSLRWCALANQSKYVVDSNGVKREEVGEVEIEFFNTRENIWKDYIDSLKDLCPLFGYIPDWNKTIGIKINPSPPINVLEDCECPSSNDFYL